MIELVDKRYIVQDIIQPQPKISTSTSKNKNIVQEFKVQNKNYTYNYVIYILFFLGFVVFLYITSNMFDGTTTNTIHQEIEHEQEQIQEQMYSPFIASNSDSNEISYATF